MPTAATTISRIIRVPSPTHDRAYEPADRPSVAHAAGLGGPDHHEDHVPRQKGRADEGDEVADGDPRGRPRPDQKPQPGQEGAQDPADKKVTCATPTIPTIEERGPAPPKRRVPSCINKETTTQVRKGKRKAIIRVPISSAHPRLSRTAGGRVGRLGCSKPCSSCRRVAALKTRIVLTTRLKAARTDTTMKPGSAEGRRLPRAACEWGSRRPPRRPKGCPRSPPSSGLATGG